MHWHNKSCKKGSFGDLCLHFDDRSLEGITLNINPTKPRGYPTLTAYKALAYACYLKFSNIYVIGLDNSNFQNIYLDSDNCIVQSSLHAVSDYSPDINLTKDYNIKIEDYFYDLAYQNRKLRECFKFENIYNLGITSFIDVFNRNADLNLLNS